MVDREPIVEPGQTGDLESDQTGISFPNAQAIANAIQAAALATRDGGNRGRDGSDRPEPGVGQITAKLPTSTNPPGFGRADAMDWEYVGRHE